MRTAQSPSAEWEHWFPNDESDEEKLHCIHLCSCFFNLCDESFLISEKYSTFSPSPSCSDRERKEGVSLSAAGGIQYLVVEKWDTYSEGSGGRRCSSAVVPKLRPASTFGPAP